ncbi:MAG: hypothetical protein LBD21_03430 [Tannerellaceae bacterium]|jgi:hypothetical protein|nr:hypothetical protein [Tannerellaceae bacterium]
MLYGITLIFLGLLAVPNIVLSRRPDAKEWYDRIAPFQAWIGLVFALIGLVGLFDELLSLGDRRYSGMYRLSGFIGSALEACLGFILGYPVISNFLSRSADAAEKAKVILNRLLPLQSTLGVIAIGVGVWRIIMLLFY